MCQSVEMLVICCFVWYWNHCTDHHQLVQRNVCQSFVHDMPLLHVVILFYNVIGDILSSSIQSEILSDVNLSNVSSHETTTSASLNDHVLVTPSLCVTRVYQAVGLRSDHQLHWDKHSCILPFFTYCWCLFFYQLSFRWCQVFCKFSSMASYNDNYVSIFCSHFLTHIYHLRKSYSKQPSKQWRRNQGCERLTPP